MAPVAIIFMDAPPLCLPPSADDPSGLTLIPSLPCFSTARNQLSQLGHMLQFFKLFYPGNAPLRLFLADNRSCHRQKLFYNLAPGHWILWIACRVGYILDETPALGRHFHGGRPVALLVMADISGVEAILVMEIN